MSTNMSNKIGRFEIVSQLAQSPFATVHKALDTETQQTVALKVFTLDRVKDRDALIKSVFEEADQAKPLSSHNIAALYGVGDEDGQLLAAAEYVQGNSVATTLAQKDGFSIWDLQDITRQVCQALDHAQVHRVVHHSLEPAKIMVQWDGMVKVLGFGMSGMNYLASESSTVPEVLHYASPEQLRGEACDHRSTLFSLGTVLYEMATEQKAFAGDTPDQVRGAILGATPPLPHRLKANISPDLSTVIMKAIAKSPDERYQSGQELVHDLEQCIAGTKKAVSVSVGAPGKSAEKSRVRAVGAAAATIGGLNSVKPRALSTGSPETKASPVTENASSKPAFAVDPLMAETESGVTLDAPATRSFSEISELPPLSEAYVAPAPPSISETVQESAQVLIRKSAATKPEVPVREVAQKAVVEIRKTPAQLYLYAIGGAVFLIALIVGGMALHNFLEERETVGSAAPAPTQNAAAPQPAAPVQTPAQAANTGSLQLDAARSEAAQPETSSNDVAEPETPPAHSSGGKPSRKKMKSRAAAALALAQLEVSSDPSGAQIAFDGSPLCQAPCALTDIAPGQHVISASKNGFGAEQRRIMLSSGTKSSVSIQLNSLVATLSVASTPAGAVILIDGKDTGKLTPSQFTINKAGAHTVLVRRSGYLEETSSVNAEPGQTANVNVNLKQLGSTDDIRAAGGKFKKVFGHGNSSGMGIVSIKTQPKGAQIMVNNRVLDRTAPFDFYLNPGTYVVDITMSGYRSLHRVISVSEGEKVAIEETLSPE